MKNLFLAVFLLFQCACTSFVSNRIQHPEIIKIDLPDQLHWISELTHRWCSDNGKSCLDYIDMPVSGEKNQINYFDITFDAMQDRLDLTIKEGQPGKDLVLILFPGYAASKQSVMLYTLWFHSLGYHALVVPGPNEHEDFDFGLTTAKNIQQMLNEEMPSGSRFVAIGFSMGIIAATTFSQAESRVSGTIGIAPMQRFDLALKAYENYFGKKWWSSLISDKKLTAALEQTLKQAKISLEETDVRTKFTKPTLLLASKSDQMAPYAYYSGLENPCVELIELENFHHLQTVSFPWEPIRQSVEHWLDSIAAHTCN